MGGRIALLFPGQGEQQLQMFSAVRASSKFAEIAGVLSELLGVNLNAVLDGKAKLDINKNAASSLLTVGCSALYLAQYLEENPPPRFLAGYSVGQWTAIYARTSFTFEALAQIVYRRAKMMDECFAESPGCMLGVIGLLEAEVEDACAVLREGGEAVWISNYNAPGQYSLAMSASSIGAVEDYLINFGPRKLVRLPVAGAWHSPLLMDVKVKFANYLAKISPAMDLHGIANNVSGELFGCEDCTEQLAAHLVSPVRWEACIRALISVGCDEFVEIGFGKQLTKFGFFIDRSLAHRALG